MSGAPNARPPLIHLANAITKNMSLLVTGHCMPEIQNKRNRDYVTKDSIRWLCKHKIRAFYAMADGSLMGQASRTLMTNVGLGTSLTGRHAYRRNSISISTHAFDMHLAVEVLRVEGGLDYSYVIESLHKEQEANASAPINGSAGYSQAVSYQNSTNSLASGGDSSSSGISSLLGKKKLPPEYKTTTGESVPTPVIDNMLCFTRKQPKGTIDGWWLFDDGGLTVLIPYILTTRSIWLQCSPRVYFLPNKKHDMASEQRRMTELLGKYRIDFTDVIMIPDVQTPAREESMSDFNALINKFVGNPSDKEGEVITEAELMALKDLTNRPIRIRELFVEHSRAAPWS